MARVAFRFMCVLSCVPRRFRNASDRSMRPATGMSRSATPPGGADYCARNNTDYSAYPGAGVRRRAEGVRDGRGLGLFGPVPKAWLAWSHEVSSRIVEWSASNGGTTHLPALDPIENWNGSTFSHVLPRVLAG